MFSPITIKLIAKLVGVEEDPEHITHYLMSLKEDVECPPGFEEGFVEMRDGVKLRYFQFSPVDPRKHVIIVPGLNTLVMSWYKFMILLKNEGYKVTYIETREKPSSIMEDRKNISYEIMIRDAIDFMKDLTDTNTVVMGSSMGSNLLINALARGAINPEFAILIGPYTDFQIPFALRHLKNVMADWNYRWLVYPLIRAFVLPLVTNKRADPFQFKKYNTALKTLDPVKFKNALNAYTGTNIWNEVRAIGHQDIETTVVLIGAGSDKLHGSEATKKVAVELEGSVFIEFESNSLTHDQPAIDLINRLDEIKNEKS